jgi:hypothetical protein
MSSVPGLVAPNPRLPPSESVFNLAASRWAATRSASALDSGERLPRTDDHVCAVPVLHAVEVDVDRARVDVPELFRVGPSAGGNSSQLASPIIGTLRVTTTFEQPTIWLNAIANPPVPASVFFQRPVAFVVDRVYSRHHDGACQSTIHRGPSFGPRFELDANGAFRSVQRRTYGFCLKNMT